MSGLLRFDTDEKQRITIPSALKIDVIPWTASAGLALLLFIGIVLLVGSVSSSQNGRFMDASGVLYAFAAPFYYALVALACLLARRSRSAWTWILAGILILFFVPQGDTSLAIALLPNSILPAMTAMIGLLALGRIMEYIHLRYVVKLSKPTLSSGTIVLYSTLILSAIFVNSSLLYDLFWS